ncbi:hypothetical protein [Cypionkella sp.]|uniref:hypothetical protein n=1 Tax=Cypionkella sp. TaxID=2811411 RepID=UPI002AB8A5CB|nr:hypothetical protein [Cypionkella sp.]MDZ4392051.1 hypothetical protein [Cypionkella sp.]
MENLTASANISPANIAAGIGLADRREICGLLALLEVSGATEILKGLAVATQSKLMKTQAPEIDRLAQISSALLNTARSTDALRLQLWFEVSQNLGLPDRIPLSLRGIKSAAAALGVRAAELLKPSVLAARVTAAGEDTSTTIKFGRKLLRVLPKGLRSSRDENISFQDVVAAELKALMDKLSQADLSGTVDPEVAAAIQKGRTAISTVAVAAGGWAAFASAVGSAGFAPFIAAAQLSAVIPFVSGPALVSFLAVMTNPVTVVASTAALGYWAIKGQSVSARETAAARVAILLAVRGLQDQDTGIAALASVLRRGHRLTEAELSHMSRNARDGLILRGRQIERRLSGEIPSPASSAPGAWGIPIKHATLPADLDVGVVAGLTAGDLLYHAAAIDPAVLKAADFSRLLDLDSPLDLAAHVESFAAAGAQIAVRGYTAEQLVMSSLVEQGHMVELAASSTMPGYDLLVDGNPVQVKCGASLSLLHEHFSKYPDIPVIADADLARMAETSGEPWAQLVSSVDGFDLDHVQSILERSLSAAEALSEGVVPVYAVIVGGARAASKAWAGEIPIEDLPAWLVLDLAIRGGLSSVGQIGGAFAGLLMIGPAGALVLGPVVGIAALLGTSQLHGLLDRAIRNPWHASVMEAAGRLRHALVNAGERRLDMMLERQFRLKDSSQNMPRELISWLDRRMADDVIHVWEILDGYGPVSTLRDAIQLLIHASAIGMADPDVLAARRQLKSLIEAKPSTVASLQQVGEKITTLAQSIPRRG